MDVSSEQREHHPASTVFDENPYTYWMSEGKTTPGFISIDLGKEEGLSGFAYTPQREHAQGMIAGGVFQISDDGKRWKDAEQFKFGNLVNDPTKRYHYFRKPITTRYIRIVAKEITANGEAASMAELDIF